VAGLKLLSPGTFESESFSESENAQIEAISEQAERYKSDSKGKNIGITVVWIKYKNGSETDMQGAVKGMINGVKGSYGVENFSHQTSEAQVDGVPATYISMHYSSFGMENYDECLLVLDESNQWQVIASYLGQSDALNETSKKII
jgi:hypothetical protein